MEEAKPFEISKHVVWEAYQRVKANKGAAGIDDELPAQVGQFPGQGQPQPARRAGNERGVIR